MSSGSIIVAERKTKFGVFLFGSIDNDLCLLDHPYRKMRAAIDRRIQSYAQREYVVGSSDVIEQAVCEVDEYAAGSRRQFTVPIKLLGSEFQYRVWQELLKIPYGETGTYSGIAQKLDCPTSVRAVAAANGANALTFIVPCHRVLGKNGTLTGYAGGLAMKQQLLNLENNLFSKVEIDS